MMDSGEKSRQDLSALADGELGEAEARKLLSQMADSDLRSTWDLYHRIGDTIRTDAMAREMSPEFSARLAARLDAEPPMLAPKRRLLSRLGAWPVTLAAVAATGFGFLVAPTLFNEGNPTGSPLPAVAAVSSDGAQLADAGPTLAQQNDRLAYIRMHHVGHGALYGSVSGARSVLTGSVSDH